TMTRWSDELSIARKGARTDKERQEADDIVRRVLHVLASRRPDVRAFRDAELNGCLVARRDVPRWLREHSGPRSGKVIAYQWHEGADGPGVPVRAGAAVERVYRLADDLKDEFVGWSHNEALYFLLTGAIVGAPSLVLDGTERTGHLIFSVNPRMSPRELGEEY